MSVRHFEPTLQLDSGLIIPAGAGLGLQLTSDASGDATWVNDNNDALQAGFVGAVNTGVITCAMSGSDLSFTNWPTGDGYYFPTASGPLVRAIVPSAPATIAPSGVTSGDYAYVQVYLTPPTTAGGTATVGYSIGTSRTTAALAAADQRGAAATSTNVLIWDGIVLNTSGTYTLVAGTPASGSIIPASTGRDRRVWARGYRSTQTVAGPVTTTSTTFTPVSSSLVQRVECDGGPVVLTLYGSFYCPYSGVSAALVFYEDGTEVSASYQETYSYGGSNQENVTTYEWDLTPAAGSHLFQPYWKVSGSATAYIDVTAGTLLFRAAEDVRPNATNGTA